jgi:hypothetical protein
MSSGENFTSPLPFNYFRLYSGSNRNYNKSIITHIRDLCVNWAPHHEGVFRSQCIAPRILDLGTRWRWMSSFTPRRLYPQGKSPWYSLGRTLGGPQSRSGQGDEEKNFQTLPALEHPIIQPVAQSYEYGKAKGVPVLQRSTTPMRCIAGVEVQLHASPASAPEDGWSAPLTGRPNPRERAPGTHPTGGRAGPEPVLTRWRRE